MLINKIITTCSAIIMDYDTEQFCHPLHMLRYFVRNNLISLENKPSLASHRTLLYKPDLFLLKIEAPQLGGLEMIHLFHKKKYFPKFVFFSSEIQHNIKALKEGVFDYFFKTFDQLELMQIIKKIHSFPFQNINYNENGLNELSHREQEVVNLLVKGKTSKKISGLLNITKNTVDTHRRKILDKTGVKSTIDLISTLKFK